MSVAFRSQSSRGEVGYKPHGANTVHHNMPLAHKLKYVQNVGDVTSAGASAAILCTAKIGEIHIRTLHLGAKYDCLQSSNA